MSFFYRENRHFVEVFVSKNRSNQPLIMWAIKRARMASAIIRLEESHDKDWD